MIVLVELDFAGSWRPRVDNIGGVRRYLAGPFSVAFRRGRFNGLMEELERAAAHKLLRDAVHARLAKRNLTEPGAGS